MNPPDGATGNDPSTGVRRAQNPVAGSAPVTRRAAQARPRGPSLIQPPVDREGGKTPPPSEREADAGTVPGPGADGTLPGRGRDQGEGLSGQAARDEWKRAQSALSAAQRRGARKYTRKADRTPGSQFKPGMARRMPPGPPESDGAA